MEKCPNFLVPWAGLFWSIFTLSHGVPWQDGSPVTHRDHLLSTHPMLSSFFLTLFLISYLALAFWYHLPNKLLVLKSLSFHLLLRTCFRILCTLKITSWSWGDWRASYLPLYFSRVKYSLELGIPIQHSSSAVVFFSLADIHLVLFHLKIILLKGEREARYIFIGFSL